MKLNILKKLRSKKGESLVESMAAILIFTMASIVLYSMVTTAGDINGKAKDKDLENQAHMVAVEKGIKSEVVEDGSTVTYANGEGTVKMTMTVGSSTINIAEVDVDFYGGQDGSLYAYYVHTDPLPTESEGG